jgi:preprotein translocase subunit YajC
MTTQLPLATLLLQLFGTGTSPLVGTLFMYAAIAAIFYFILIRPQQKQRKAHEELIGTLKKGDEVITAGGIVGEVVSIKPMAADGSSTGTSPDDRITIKSAESRLVVERGRITRIIPRAGAAPTTS